MSSSGKAKVFLFGGTGTVGAAILDVLTHHHGHHHSNYQHHFEVTALIRADTLESKDEKKAAAVAKLKAAGVHLVTGDVLKAEASEIAKWITGQEIVLSALNSHVPGPSIELKLLEAVKLAKVPWFVPAIFSSDVTKAVTRTLPLLAQKKEVAEAVLASGVNSFFILNYLFTEYLISPFFGVDLANATVTAIYDFNVKTTTTTIHDIAHLTVEALLQRNEAHVKNQWLHIAGDTVSFNDVVKILEEHFKKPFKKVVATKEEVEAAVAADTDFKNIVARFRVVFGEQKGVFLDDLKDTWNAKHAKNIPVTTVKEYVATLKP